jgi:hypothetical protein
MKAASFQTLMGRIMWLALAAVCAAVLSLAAAFLYLDPQIPKAATYRQVKLETPFECIRPIGNSSPNSANGVSYQSL